MNDYDKIREELEWLLSEGEESDYTIITLKEKIEYKIEWRDYFDALIQLIDLKKIHIEEDGYISWLWNPNLVKELKTKNLLLEYEKKK